MKAQHIGYFLTLVLIKCMLFNYVALGDSGSLTGEFMSLYNFTYLIQQDSMEDVTNKMH